MHRSTAVHVAHGYSYFMIRSIITNASAIVTFAILARIITPKDMGVLTVLSLVNALCLTISTLGLQQAATRFIAHSASRGESQIACSVFYQTIRTTAVLSMIPGALVFYLARFLSNLMLGEGTYAIFFQILAFDIVLYAGAIPALSGTMLGLRKFREIAGIGIVNALVRQSLIILLIVTLRNFVGLVEAWVVGDLAAVVVYVFFVVRELGRPRFKFPLGRLLQFSWPLWISNWVNFAYQWFDRALLLFFVPLGTVGVYNATVTASGVLDTVSDAMTSALFPSYSATVSPDQRESLSNAIRVASRYVSLTMVPIGFGLLATARPALTLLVGPAYQEGSVPLMILAGAFALTVIGAAIGPVLLALGETRLSLAVVLVSVVVSSLAAFVLLPVFGMIGASIARALAMLIGLATTISFVRHKVSLRIDVEAFGKSVIAGIAMVMTVLAIQILLYDEFLLPAYAVAGFMVYLVMLRLLKAVRKEDILLLESYFGGRLNLVTRLLARILL